MNTKTRNILGWFITCSICLSIILFRNVIAQVIPPTFAMGGLYLRGEPRHFSIERGLQSYSYQVARRREAERITDAARLIVRDSIGLELWNFGSVQLWIPAGSVRSQAYDLAEQAVDIYGGRFGARKGDVVLDVGASIGLYSLKALHAGASKVIAVEPVPVTVECLRRNLSDEIAQGNAIVVPKGAWDREESLEMYITNDPTSDSFVRGDTGRPGSRRRLPLTTIDSMVRQLGIERVDFIKLDIEGAERRAIAGATRVIQWFHPRLAVCVYHLPEDPTVIPEILRQAWNGYSQTCGTCEFVDVRIRPQVYFFH